MSRLMEMLFLAVEIISTLGFCLWALRYMSELDKKNLLLKDTSSFFLAGIVITAVCLINASSSGNKVSNICSFGILLVVAAVDEITGYIHDWWNYVVLPGTLVFSLTEVRRNLTERELLLIVAYLIFVISMGLLHGIGAGDVPILMALLLYYLRTATFPADATIFLLLLSVGIALVRCLINRKKWLPFVPAICMAHLFTTCVWV